MVRYQSRQATCAANSVVNALSVLGHDVSEDQVVLASGMRDLTKGMGEREVKRALTALGYTWDEIHVAQEPYGYFHLLDALRHGAPVLLAVDSDTHWVSAVGTLGGAVLVADGANNDHVVSYDRPSLMSRWAGVSRRPYYGLAVRKAAVVHQ